MQNVMMKYDSTYVQILVFRWHLPSSFSSPPLVPFFSLGKIHCSRNGNLGERARQQATEGVLKNSDLAAVELTLARKGKERKKKNMYLHICPLTC